MNNMDSFFRLIVISMLCEALWEISKTLLPYTIIKKVKNINAIGSICIGIILAFITKTNVFDILGISLSNNSVGFILTGFLISRGSNYIHDLIKKITTDTIK